MSKLICRTQKLIYILSVNYLQMPHLEVIIDRIHVDVFKHVGGKTIQQKLPISLYLKVFLMKVFKNPRNIWNV